MGITRWFAIIVKALGGQDVRHTLEALDCHVGAKLKLTKTADRGAARARFFALAPHGDLTNGWTQLESSDLPCVGEIYETPLRARKVGLRRNGSLHVVCPSHGSKTPPYSERPISAAGKARIGAAARDMWARYRQLKAAGLPTGRPKKPAATPRALAPRATNPAYLLAIIWSRIPSPEGLSFESLLCVEISFGIARIILCGASRPNRSMDVRGNST